MMFLFVLFGCTSPSPSASPLTLADCHISGLEAESRCGTFTVFEDRAAGAGRTIDLNVLVVPSISPSPEPDPLFFLAGGPGQAASEIAATMYPFFRKIQARRDLVFVDQRGTGKSNPLRCPRPDKILTLPAMLAQDMAALMADCVDALQETADLRLYTTPIAMDDLNAIRAALGYEQINLYGASYGTRAGLVYMRRHPDTVRTAILDGLAPPQMPVGLYFARDGQAALDAMFTDCEADATCAATFPTLRADYTALLQRLETPETTTFPDPRTGESLTLEVDRDLLAAGVQGVLYQPIFTSLLPLSLDQAMAGDFGPFIAQAFGTSAGITDAIYDGMRMAVMCSEDIPRYPDPDERQALSAETSLGDGVAEELFATCAGWPRARLPAGYDAPVAAETPTLLLSGALDPVTPPTWADIAAETLPNARHVIAPGAGHNVAPYGCAPKLMEDFINAGAVEGLDVDCIEKVRRPPFFIDFSGPTP